MARPSPPVRIAVVDDDEAVLRAVGFALGAEGYAVTTYPRGQGLLCDEGATGFACLVVDFRLPDGDGLSLIRALRARGVRAPAILVTSQPDARCRRTAADLGAPIVEKPLMGDGLSERIRAALA